MNEKISPLEPVEGEGQEDEHYRLQASVLTPTEVKEIIESSEDPIQALERVGMADARKRGREHQDPLWDDAVNSILAGTIFLRRLLGEEGPLRFSQALEGEEDLAEVKESIQAVKGKNMVGWERPPQAEVTPYLTRVTIGEVYKEARGFLLPELKALADREIDRLR